MVDAKTKELFEKFEPMLGFNEWGFSKELRINQAKRCAIICVDEILNINLPGLTERVSEGKVRYSINPILTYWQSVKQEIEKL